MAESRSVLKRGQSAMDTLKREQEAAEARREASQNGVYRFYVPKAKNGHGYETVEVVVLDEDALDSPFAHEHNVPGKGNNFKESRQWICVDEVADCALCRAQEMGMGEEFKHPSYNKYVTVGDLSEYTVQKGARKGQKVDYSRKLMVIPQGSVQTYNKIFELAMKQHGTTRGMIMRLTKEQQMDPRCGRPTMMDSGTLFEMEDEDFLEQYACQKVVRDGKTVIEEGENIEPFDYEKILAPPDQSMLRKIYNIPAPAGSAEEEEEQTNSPRRRRRGSSDAAGEAPPPRTRRDRAQSETTNDEAGGDDDDGGEGDDAPASTGTRRRRRGAVDEAEAAPAEVGTRRRRVRAGETDDGIPF